MRIDAFHRLVLADMPPLWAKPVRGALSLMSMIYAQAVRRRNRRFDRTGPDYRSAVPVISVGNLTTGGTGKTPMVIELLDRLVRRGMRPAVLMRGYRADVSGINDEQRLIQRACPNITCLADPDRCRAARAAVEQHGADAIVLDDGFQHRRLARDLDIVLIDATCPFGFDRLLPRGLLREPVEGLRRAGAVIVTRADEVTQASLGAVRERLRTLTSSGVVLFSRHRVVGVTTLAGEPVPAGLAGRRVFAFAGIGNPRSFQATLVRMGAEVVGTRWLADHAAYRDGEIRRLVARTDAASAEWLVTTEKDAVKLASDVERHAVLRDRLRIVRIAVEMLDDGDRFVDDLIERVVAPRGR